MFIYLYNCVVISQHETVCLLCTVCIGCFCYCETNCGRTISDFALFILEITFIHFKVQIVISTTSINTI